MNVKNIFNLLGRIHQEEDRMTVAFGNIISNSNHLFLWFMTKIGFNDNIKCADFYFDTQKFEKHIHDKNRTDLTISNKKYYIIVESKIGGNEFDKEQLSRYYNMMTKHALDGKKVKLVLITQLDELKRFEDFVKKERLILDKVAYFRWCEIQDAIRSLIKGQIIFTANQFDEFLGDKMYDETKIDECTIKDIEEVAVFAVDNETMNSILYKKTKLNEYAYFQAQEYEGERQRLTGDAQYIAFYQLAPVFTITHIAKLKRTRKNVPSEETTNPNYWNRRLYNGYFFEKPKKLVFPIKNTIDKNGKRFRVGNPTYTSFSKLFSAKNIRDALKKY